jgi:Protein of unknown function (DUF2934)
MDEMRELIARKAYELWEQAGRHGSDVDHWLEAERQIRMEQSGNKPGDAALRGGGEISPIEGGASDATVIDVTAEGVAPPPGIDEGEKAEETEAIEQAEPLK